MVKIYVCINKDLPHIVVICLPTKGVLFTFTTFAHGPDELRETFFLRFGLFPGVRLRQAARVHSFYQNNKTLHCLILRQYSCFSVAGPHH